MSKLRVDTIETLDGLTTVNVGDLATSAEVSALTASLASATGASLIGYGASTVEDALDEALSGAGGGTYASVASATTVTLDSAVASTFGVAMASPITNLVLTSGEANKVVVIDALFSQNASGGNTVNIPANLKMPAGVSSIASVGASEITLARFTNYNNGDVWYYQRLGVFTTATGATGFPSLVTENATFTDEGLSTAGWTPTNCTMSQSVSTVRHTKTAGGSSSNSVKALTFTPTNTDYILFGKMKAKHTANDAAVLTLLSGSKEASIWFGSADGGSTPTLGAISIVGVTGAATRNIASIATGFNYETTSVEFALHYDHKFHTLTAWFREGDGRWKWKGRVACDWFSTTEARLAMTSLSAANSWVEFDYIMLARPNLAVISDSISEGKTLFSPDPALALTNDESTWMRHAVLYPTLRNNLVVNKGVGGNTSAQIFARIADATITGAKVIMVQASNNDEAAGVSLATRTTNIQNTIDAITTAGASAVLLNGVYATSTAPDNTPTPDFRDYMKSWWDTNRLTLNGVSLAIDVMEQIKVPGDFMNSLLTQADGVHPNVAGHTVIGDYIETFA